MNKILKLTLILGVVGAISGGALAAVYKVTGPVISAQDAKTLQAGLSEVFPGDYQFEGIDEEFELSDSVVKIDDAYIVKSNGGIIGLVLQVTSPGSQAPIKLLVGTKKDGTVSGVKILESLETPGLGANASNSDYYVEKENKITFLGQFKGKKFSDNFVPKEDVIAITGATITSTAVARGVKVAGRVAHNYFKEKEGSG
ncbi:MAG: RnfABCDGE type electron transport complex subunit G [Caldisericaceae bacterium]|nr:RnfABCDGE type electron transport complex subunit G [Caldisericaceae bacterium]